MNPENEGLKASQVKDPTEISKRELFAAMAMQGHLSLGWKNTEAKELARRAVQFADDLIAELEK